MRRPIHRQQVHGTLFCLLMAAGLGSVLGQSIGLLGHTTPAYVGFSDPIYEAAAGESHAVVTVIRTGEYREPVTVGYATEDGTARAGQDYTAMRGVLFIPAGVGIVTFTIPILNSGSRKAPATVRLKLLDDDPRAFIVVRDATLRLLAEPDRTAAELPTLSVRADGTGEIVISWPVGGAICVLEKTADPASANWQIVDTAVEVAVGYYTVTEPPVGSHSFYRLRTP